MRQVQLVSDIDILSQPNVVILPVGANLVAEKLKATLQKYRVSGIAEILGQFCGKKKQFKVLFSDHPKVHGLILCGLGEGNDLGFTKHTVMSVVAGNVDESARDFLIDFSQCPSGLEEAVGKGIVMGTHDVGKYKSAKKGDVLGNVFAAGTTAIKDLQLGISIGQTINSIIDLVNAPSNKKSPQTIAGWMQEAGAEVGMDIEIKDKESLLEEGFHALLAVNRGSENPATCIVAKYNMQRTSLPLVAFVGKGVTFDTGGLSVKPSNNMHYMKSDMGGAAAVMGAAQLVAALKLPVRLLAVIPATDNSVDAHSTKPGDIISSYSGQTIEVIDTDAEGRLILADALSYVAKQYNPECIIDLATLTGSAVRALGVETAAAMTHNDSLFKELSEAGDQVGERIWRLPLWRDYHQYMESDVADIRNLSTKPMAGAITAAKFLEFFVEEHPAWIHLDIAGTAFGTVPTTKGYSATGFGIDLLIQWLRNRFKYIDEG